MAPSRRPHVFGRAANRHDHRSGHPRDPRSQPQAVRGQEGGEQPGALGAHRRDVRPHQMAEGRRAAAHHRSRPGRPRGRAAGHAGAPDRSQPLGLGFGVGFGFKNGAQLDGRAGRAARLPAVRGALQHPVHRHHRGRRLEDRQRAVPAPAALARRPREAHQDRARGEGPAVHHLDPLGARRLLGGAVRLSRPRALRGRPPAAHTRRALSPTSGSRSPTSAPRARTLRSSVPHGGAAACRSTRSWPRTASAPSSPSSRTAASSPTTTASSCTTWSPSRRSSSSRRRPSPRPRSASPATSSTSSSPATSTKRRSPAGSPSSVSSPAPSSSSCWSTSTASRPSSTACARSEETVVQDVKERLHWAVDEFLAQRDLLFISASHSDSVVVLVQLGERSAHDVSRSRASCRARSAA